MAGDPSRQTVSAVLDRAAALFGDAEALVDGEVRLTYTALRAQVHTAARALIGMGVQPGDRSQRRCPRAGRGLPIRRGRG
jgi:non-ribosomal peptide synthetase component E (peptide arylation enzyme)